MQTVNILFGSVGRRVELVRAFRHAYEALGLEGSLVATEIDTLAPALQLVDKGYLVPRLDDPAYIPELIEICKAEQIHLLFPLIDPEVPVLARARAELEAAGVRPAVLTDQHVAAVSDKWLTFELFDSIGVPTPRSWLPDRLPDEIEFPVFIKPRSGSAAKDTFRVDDARRLEFFLDYIEEPIVQEFLDGPEITSDVVCDMDGELLGVVSRKRLEVRSGEVAKGVTVRDPEIERHCVTIAKALDVVGPITAQCIVHGGHPYFTEVNPRFAGGSPLAIAAGADFPTWILARAAGVPLDIPPLGTYTKGLFVTRFDDCFILDERERSRAASRRV